MSTLSYIKGIEIDSIKNIRTVAIFNALINERSIEYKKAELLVGSMLKMDSEKIKSLLDDLYDRSFPWIEIDNKTQKEDLIDLLKEYKR